MTRATSTLLVAALLLCAPLTALAAEGVTPLDESLERYWGDERDPDAIRWRLHPKDGRNEIALTAGVITDDPFRSYIVPGLSYNRFLGESFAIGAMVALPSTSFSDLGEFLDSRFPKNDALNAEEIITLLAGVEAAWLPFYGKLSLLGIKLAHFDLGLLAGAGVAQAKFSEFDERASDFVETEGMTPSFHLGVGLRLHLHKYLALRVDYREQFISSTTPAGGFLTPSTITVGLATLLPYPEDLP
jgi:outer membrane beta-barrel protein